MITQCPHCGSRFRVTEVQLGRADGKTRCGACLEIFQATDSLVAEDGDPQGANPDIAAEELGKETAALAGESVAEDEPGADAQPPAPSRSRGAIWVRWALVVAVLVLIGQVLWYLGYI